MTSSMALQSGASSSLSVTSRWAYDVFLSFRGEDVRNNFVSHLYDALCRKGINTYIDDNLERGEEISSALLKAIEESRISIIILSENYAKSTWCLDELKKILECKETKQQIVLPVFYKVDPSVVRNRKRSYGEAMANHEHKLNDDHKRVERWTAALTEVANLSGLHLEKDGNESKFIQEIAQTVTRIVNHTYLNVAKHPIGVESRVHAINMLLRVGMNDIRMIGVLGVGGVGKTTITKAIYNLYACQFEDSCFLAKVRETSKRESGLVQLQEKLLYDVLGDSSLKVDNVDRGINIIKERLCCKRILLVLDDVDQLAQLEALSGESGWFGLGSRIIITTRDKHLLTKHKVVLTYKVKEMDHDEALHLFSWHAFKKDKPIDGFVQLSEHALRCAGGLPLALEVLGSDLYGRSLHEWKSALDKWKRLPNKNIHKILRISYDDLDDYEKYIFLDIACFFKGEDVDYVIKILDGCGFSPSIGIRVLMDKSLIAIEENNRLVMHDLIQEMGREIVHQESPKEPGRRSRLWFHEDVRHVLEENVGTNKIEGILVKLPKRDLIHLSPKAFTNMKRLRLFINRNACSSGGPNYLSNELRLLDWPGYPSQSLPSNFHGKKLVDLRISNSPVKDLGVRLQNFQKLTRMDFFRCEFLTKIPDLSRTPNLEWLDVASCPNLVEVHASVGSLKKLEHFSFMFCTNLINLPRSLKFRHLKHLCAIGCSSLQNFPEIEFEKECLRRLSLACTDIKELPLSIGHITGLEELDLSGCKNLVHIPTGIPRFQHFPTGKNLVSVPNIFKDECCSIDLPGPNILMRLDYYFTLKNLYLSKSDIIRLPESLNQFVELKTLDLRYCKRLQQIPALPPKIENVDATGCISLESFPDELGLPRLFTSQPGGIGWIKFCRSSEAHIEKLSESTIIFPGNTIPNLFSHRKQSPNNPSPMANGFEIGLWKEEWSSCRITINGQKILEKIRGILICVILEPIQKTDLNGGTYLCFTVGWNVAQEDRAERHYVDLWGSGDHVWLHYAILDEEKWSNNAAIHDHLNPLNLQVKVFSGRTPVFIKSCGAHLVLKNEKEGEDHPAMRRVADVFHMESTSYQQNRGSSTLAIEFEQGYYSYKRTPVPSAPGLLDRRHFGVFGANERRGDRALLRINV